MVFLFVFIGAVVGLAGLNVVLDRQHRRDTKWEAGSGVEWTPGTGSMGGCGAGGGCIAGAS